MGIFSPLRIRTYKRYSQKIHEFDFVIDDHHTYCPNKKGALPMDSAPPSAFQVLQFAGVIRPDRVAELVYVNEERGLALIFGFGVAVLNHPQIAG